MFTHPLKGTVFLLTLESCGVRSCVDWQFVINYQSARCRTRADSNLHQKLCRKPKSHMDCLDCVFSILYFLLRCTPTRV